MSSLDNARPNPTQFVENGHCIGLRRDASFGFDADGIVLAAGASAVVRFVTGDLAVVFEGGKFTVDQENVLFQVYEDVAFSADGVANLTYVHRHNRLSTRESQLVAYDGAVVDTLGDRILHDRVLGTAGQGQNKPGFGSDTAAPEIVLKPNTEHVFQVTNDSIAQANIEVHFSYREVDPREYS